MKTKLEELQEYLNNHSEWDYNMPPRLITTEMFLNDLQRIIEKPLTAINPREI